MAPDIIEAWGLTKTFHGGVVAVKDLDFAVKAGAVYGLIGRNGSGKTTMLRLLLGLLLPDRGTASILGCELWRAPREVRQRVAYVSQTQRLPNGVTLEDLCRQLKRFYQRWDQAHAQALARSWNLPWRRPLGGMSSGEQRQAALLLVFASRPDLLILDEPAAGFDPLARRALLDQILDAVTQSDGCTVLLSTHIVADLERIADYIGMIDCGRLGLSSRLDDLLDHTKRVQVIFDDDECPPGFVVPGALRSFTSGAVVGAIVRWPNGNELDILRASTGARVQVFPVGLEEIFLALVGDQGNDNDSWKSGPLIHANAQ